MEVETQTITDKGFATCPYCGQPDAFPKDFRMWGVSEQVELQYRKMEKIKMMAKKMEKMDVTPGSMHLSAKGEMSFTVKEKRK